VRTIQKATSIINVLIGKMSKSSVKSRENLKKRKENVRRVMNKS
jgi:hypothetical protein